jgi:hypothetical protein
LNRSGAIEWLRRPVPSSAGGILIALPRRIEPSRGLQRHFYGQGREAQFSWEPDMSRAARILSVILAPRIYTERSANPVKEADSHQLVAVALFAGIGLFVSLVAVIMGMQGEWF